MTREEAIKTWLPIISMGIDNMPELKEALDMAIKALEQEPTTKNDLAVDCISRKAVKRIINKWLSHPDYELKDHIYSMTEKIHSLPSVTPQEPRKGHWVPYLKEGLIVKCSECKSRYTLGYNYCPNCGADMREIEE